MKLVILRQHKFPCEFFINPQGKSADTYFEVTKGNYESDTEIMDGGEDGKAKNIM